MTAGRSETPRRAGYAALIEMLDLDVIPNWHESLVAAISTHRIDAVGGIVQETYPQAEALFSFVETTIDTELVEELSFLANYDRTKAAIQGIVDMPDREIDLFIRLCIQYNGRLSQQKRESHFAFLTADEIARMEEAVREAYGVVPIE